MEEIRRPMKKLERQTFTFVITDLETMHDPAMEEISLFRKCNRLIEEKNELRKRVVNLTVVCSILTFCFFALFTILMAERVR